MTITSRERTESQRRRVLDGGNLGAQRKLYCRELIARFGHNLALNWNLGEENTQSTAQQKAMIDYIADLDAYDHNIVVHTFPDQQDKVYRPAPGQRIQANGSFAAKQQLRNDTCANGEVGDARRPKPANRGSSPLTNRVPQRTGNVPTLATAVSTGTTAPARWSTRSTKFASRRCGDT